MISVTMPSIFKAWSFLALTLPIFASPIDDGSISNLAKKATCNRDNLLRCFDPTASAAAPTRAAATEFCSSYLSIPVVTSIVSTEILTTTTATVTAHATITLAPIAKRASTANPVACTAQYSANQLSSACSCLSIVPSTTYTTIVSTNTIVSTATNALTATVTPVPQCTSTVNLIRNPGFEAGFDFWSLSIYGGNKPSVSSGNVGGGSNSNNAYSIQSGSSGTGMLLTQQISGLVVGATYQFHYDYMFKTNNVASSISCGIYPGGLSSQSTTNGAGENSWLSGPSWYGSSFVATATSGKFECTIIARGAMTWKVDNFYVGC